MKTFKQYFTDTKKLTEDVEVAGWILPNGEAETVPLYNHARFVVKNAKKFGLKPKMGSKTPVERAIENGAVRFHITSNQGYKNGEIGASKFGYARNRRRILDILKTYGVENYTLFTPGEGIQQLFVR